MVTKSKNPRRVQARRAKNYKAVHRPTKWGNPFAITPTRTRAQSLRDYSRWLRRRLANDPTFLEPLRGHDLGCFCPLDEPCHADLLLAALYGAAPRSTREPRPRRPASRTRTRRSTRRGSTSTRTARRSDNAH